jgi:hypothetical protein
MVGQIGFDPLTDAMASAFRGPQGEQVADGDLHRVVGIRPAASVLQELMRTQRIWRRIFGLSTRPDRYLVEELLAKGIQ